MQPVFDGHNDTLLRLWRACDLEGRRFLDGDWEGHIDPPRARAGGLTGGFFAIYVPGGVEPGDIGDGDDGGITTSRRLGLSTVVSPAKPRLRQAGYGKALVNRICHDNWTVLLRRTIG